MYKDRPYQTQAADAAILALKEGYNAPVITAATGTGKSLIISSICQRLIKANTGIKIVVATHVAELVDQNNKKFQILCPDIKSGVYSAGLGRKEINETISFVGIHSAYKLDLGIVNLLIIDEAHSLSKKSTGMWQQFINTLKSKNPNLKIIGLTATDFRMDSGSLVSGDDCLFDKICFSYGLGTAIKDGYLVELKAKGTKTVYDISKVGKVAGEYNLKELEAATNLPDSNISAVNEIIESARKYNKKSWLVFCNGVKHSFEVRNEFLRRGITCETVTGETPDYERDRILKDFQSGAVTCVTNNAVWTTGVDVPNVDLIGMMRHTMSGGLLLQMAGRGTRVTIDLNPYETAKQRKEAIAASLKPDCLFLDFAGNIKRHGFLDQIKGKDKKEKGDGVAPMKDCPDCASICHAAAKKCPDCGYIFPVNEEEVLGSAYNGSVISTDMEKYVINVMYSGHNLKKEGKTPCLRVKYMCDDGQDVNEYICLQHQGFAKTKADKWWKERGGADISNMTVEQIVDAGLCVDLLVPESIVVKKEGKYDRIFKYSGFKEREAYNYNSLEAKTLAEADDISLW